MADPVSMSDSTWYDNLLRGVVAIGAAIGAYVGLSRRKPRSDYLDAHLEAKIRAEVRHQIAIFRRELAEEQQRQQLKRLEDRLGKLE